MVGLVDEPVVGPVVGLVVVLVDWPGPLLGSAGRRAQGDGNRHISQVATLTILWWFGMKTTCTTSDRDSMGVDGYGRM